MTHIICNDQSQYSEPPASELKVILSNFGGIVELVLGASTDYQIAQNLAQSKILKLKQNHKVIHTRYYNKL